MAPSNSATAAAAVDEPLTQDEVAQIPSAALPIRLQISHLLGEFTQLSIQLFAIISTISPSTLPPAGTQSATEPIYEALAAVDRKLAALLVMYDSHRRRQRRIEALIRELGTLDSQWRDSALTLQQCLADLSPVIESGALDRQAITTARQAHHLLTPETVLSYARLLAPFTSAPPASLFPPEVKLKGVGATDPTGRSLPAGAIPPFPTEATMRGGRLQFGSEGLLHGGGYLGETEQVGAGAFAFFFPCQPGEPGFPCNPHGGGKCDLLLMYVVSADPARTGRRDSTTGALIPPELEMHGATTTAPRPDDTAARLEHEAKLHGAAGPGGGGEGNVEGEGVSDFVFDLDLNPDL